MKLAPEGPPGRPNCKARAYQAEIQRLHSEGYSCQAIREALAQVGIKVARSTVHREVILKPLTQTPLPRRPMAFQTNAQASPSRVQTQPVAPGSTLIAPYANDKRSSKEIAAEFMENFNSNPLLRDR